MKIDLLGPSDSLMDRNNQPYGLLPIPSQRDAEITSLLHAWMTMDEPSRKAALTQITDAQRWTLLAYSERMATLAVRNEGREHILMGLLALGLDGWRGDWRDNAVIICLHYDATKRIDVPAETVFAEAAKWLPAKVADALQSFLARSDEDKSLAAMGYVAGADAYGFRYQRTW